ncbi:MAG: DUF805 domain-containing protein [Rhizomicrobium sp.]|jgi:uncharacterized membrane protein YhaH (DUF805 family)
MDWGHYFFSFNGRLNRAKQWLFLGLILVPALVYEGFVTNYLGVSWKEVGRLFSTDGFNTPTGQKALTLMLPLWLIIAFLSLTIGVKRLHDRNKNGLWIILFIYVPWALGFLHSDPMGVFRIAALALNIWAFIELYCLRGTRGDNRFGPDPLAPSG